MNEADKLIEKTKLNLHMEKLTTRSPECQCHHFIRPPIYVHLHGCPVGSAKQIAEYDRLPWYKKLLTRSPKELYYEHFRA